jgi:very-short-patch-repair endonuclease
MTDAEARIWSRIRAHRLDGASFRRQVPIGSYIVDFACMDKRVIIEIDGGQHAENARDAKRDAWLKAQGFVILRYWNNDALSNTNGVLEHIAYALAASTPPSLTLPRKGGGNRKRGATASSFTSSLSGKVSPHGGPGAG